MPSPTLVDLVPREPVRRARPAARSIPRPTRGTRYEAGLSRRTVWVALSGWTAIWGLLHAAGAGYSWHYFALGARLLTSPSPTTGGVHLYAAHPELQIGPLALLVAAPLRHLDPWQGRVAAPVLLTAAGLLLLAALVRVRERSGPVGTPVANPLVLVTGLLVLPVWCELATHYAHLDDALALAAVVLATGAARRGQAVAVALLLAAAVDSKPWALACCVLLLTLPEDRRRRATLVFAVGVAIAWLPFVFGDSGTLSLGHFAIHNVDSSALRALGVSNPGTPSWDRPAQLLLGLVVAAVAVRRHRWSAVLLAAVAARLLLDPQTYPYYTTGLLVGAALVDLHVPGRRFPMWTGGAALLYVLDQAGGPVLSASALGLLRAAYCLAVLVALAAPGRQGCAIPLPAAGGGSRGNTGAPAPRTPPAGRMPQYLQ